MIAFLFDTETTGLISNHVVPLDKQPSLIELYGVTVDLTTGEVMEEVSHLIKPPKPVSEEITRITGLADKDLQDSPAFSQLADELQQAIERQPLVIAHNLSFDVEMIDMEYERLGRNLAWPPKLCLVEATVHLKGFRLSLTALHEHLFGEKFADAHRAQPDVEAMVRCAVKLFEMGEL